MRAKLAIAGVLLALVGAGFYWYSQRGTKLSETDTILIGDFANATGDPVFDGTLREALTVSLAQSPLLNLISVEKVSEALRALGRPIDTPITRDLAPRLCQRLPVPGLTQGRRGGPRGGDRRFHEGPEVRPGDAQALL